MSPVEPANKARSGPGRDSARAALLSISVVALALFAGLGAIVSTHPRTAFDDNVRRWVAASNGAVGNSFFSFVSTVGSVTPMIVYAFIIVLFVVVRHRSLLVPLTVLFAPVVAVLAYLGSKSIVARTRPSGMGNAFEGTYSFPSAHATTSSAVCFALWYLLYREGFVSGLVGAVVATTVCLLVGLSRVYLDVHWATDVIGGWCLGIAVGGATAALYASAGSVAATSGAETSRE